MRYVNRPNCLPARNLGDLSSNRDSEYIAKIVQKVEDINKVLLNAHIEKTCTKTTKYIQESIPGLDKVIGANKDKVICSVTKKYSILELPKTIEYWDVEGDFPVQTICDTKELILRRLAFLDIIKKSQQRKKSERNWGKLQTDKTLTRNGKQKILEAGAVIDKHVGNTNAFALTLTLPGSGWSAYDVLSRYSGYIVNRLGQIIRRAEAKGVSVHWFFVWEHQKRGALHMHWCIAVESDWRIGNLLCLELRAKWFALLEDLSVLTRTDLFAKRGLSGTWRHTPEVWQADIFRVKKSVAGYFSKYCSKSHGESDILSRRRAYEERKSALNPDCADSARVYSLSPARYWGSASRTKKLCQLYSVTICFNVASPREGDWVYQIIRGWLLELSPKLTEVSRYFKKIAPDTGFIYCQGWERKAWFDKSVMDDVVVLFKRIHANQLRKVDAIGALCELNSF